MRPRDIQSLLDQLRREHQFQNLTNNLLSQWGPKNRVMLASNFLPPRLVDKNQDTISQVHFRTVAAQDGTRYSPSQILDGGEIFGSINYRLGHSDGARQIVGPDYDGIVRYVNQNMSMQAAARVLGIFDQFVVQALVEHDEMANWEAIVSNSITRRGDNAYFEYENGPDITGHRVAAGGDWTDPTYDPYLHDIIPRVRYLTKLGYARAGIRTITSDHTIQTLADNPFTTIRAFAGFTPTGQTIQQAANVATETEVFKVFAKIGLPAPIAHDLRIQTRTGEKRAYPEGNMTFIASTGRSEEVIYNQDDPSQVRIVSDTLGFNGIGVANGQPSPGRRSAQRAFTDQKDARIEFEGWQASGPVILEPSAIANVSGITELTGWF